ncbi:hypothetical protein [Williamsia serinedens]|uniref:Tetratricopeptide repeat protein n=1 Tax=Williamsia serinedens TaxID=391736 RepID=A0ABT1H7F1_9NOCA|nr:hypothetical protein [Williamsia serinedens]MCP2163091.1 hypothetical protein [Williamsia serinedens]
MSDSTDAASEPDEVMAAIVAAMQLATTDAAAARAQLDALWERVGAGGDALHRCTIGHYRADLCDDAAEALTWDIRALDAAHALTDVRAQAHHSSLSVEGFYPSLHLNLADNYRRLGSVDAAHHHLAEARSRLSVLTNLAYRQVVSDGVEHVTAALEAGSTERLPGH